MKRLFIMLLIACSAVSTISADSAATPQKKAKSVVKDLEGIIAFYAKEGSETTSVIKNPETGLVEASERIVPFTCKKEDLWAIPIGFRADEPLSYQYMHLLPGNTELFTLKVVTNNGQKSKDVRIRTNSKQEMWFMCCKNPDNPQLRDAYAIVWEETKVNHVAGTVFIITSLRPDMYEKNFESSKKMFKIVGRVDDEIKDSLYNIYIADSREALYNLQDHEYVACVPVVNKRFEWQTELTKPCVGRLRCIFPDGSLCSAWIDLDFVPGETYNITVHNGYYDEDKDYERRVGRQSGKSLIEPNAVKVVDAVPAEYRKATDVNSRNTLSQLKTAKLKMKAELVELEMEDIQAKYKMVANTLKTFRSRDRVMLLLDQILQKNKDLDKKFQEFIKLAKSMNMPVAEMQNLYKEILEFYTKQNKALYELSKDSMTNGKNIRKLQEYVTKQTEKYLKDLENSLE